MKVCFLDFDGVFTMTRAYFVHGEYVERRAVTLLNKVLNDTDTKVVVSSSWRIGAKDYEIRRFLDLAGFKTKLHSDRVTTNIRGVRGAQIQEWLDRHPEVTNYIIVDDDSDMLPHQLDNFIHVDGCEGFSYRDYTRALHVLNGGHAVTDESCEFVHRPFKTRGVGRGQTIVNHNILSYDFYGISCHIL